MKKQNLYLTLSLAVTFVLSGIITVSAQPRAYRVTDRQVMTLLNRIENRTDTFRRQMDSALDRNRYRGTLPDSTVEQYIDEFEKATDQLRSRFDSNTSVANDVQEVLNRAYYIDQFIITNTTLAPAARNQWSVLRRDLDTLATYYNVRWNWQIATTTPGWQTGRGIPAYSATDAQLRNLLTRIESKTDVYKRQMDNAISRSRWNESPREERVEDFIEGFENATDRLKQRFDARETVAQDANDVLMQAAYIDRFMRNNAFTRPARNQWNSIRTDLDTLANYYRVTWSWNQQLPRYQPYRWGTTPGGMPVYSATDAQMRNLLTQIESKTDVYARQMDSLISSSRWNNTNREERIEDFIDGFENATDRLKQRFDARETVAQDANDVLLQAAYVDRFMRNNAFTRPARSQWNSIRSDMYTLANYYRVSWNWNQQLPPYQPYQWGTPGTGGWTNASLTGTYRLNTAASDNVSQVVSRAIGNYNVNQRTRIQQNLERRLNSPEMIAIEQSGRNVTMASTLAPQITFAADGVSRTETGPGGRSISTSATLRGNNLEVSYTGDRARDFWVTFSPLANGNLQVSRRIYLENRNEMITVNSVYTKVAPVARWNDVNVNQYPGQNTGVNAGTFYVPNGTRLTAVLRTPITTDASQVNDRFAMEVTSPNQYRGAVIEGYVVALDDSGRLTGRANVTLDFDTIRLTNGQTYRFAGLINTVRDHDGDTIGVTNEGTLREGSRTTETITRGGIGAALGAILGAVLGGGEGAAIGAGVGAGAGVGSVLLGGRDDLDLQAGSQFDLTASSPANLGYNQP